MAPLDARRPRRALIELAEYAVLRAIPDAGLIPLALPVGAAVEGIAVCLLAGALGSLTPLIRALRCSRHRRSGRCDRVARTISSSNPDQRGLTVFRGRRTAGSSTLETTRNA